MAGRRTLYTPDRVEKIINALSVGAYEKEACRVAGISEDTFARWQARYADFADRVSRATAEGWIGDLAVIRRAALQGDWRAAGEHLDRTGSPYRKSTDGTVTVKHGGTVTHQHAHRDLSAFRDDEIEAMSRVAERAKAERQEVGR